jgi:hypothetical protein
MSLHTILKRFERSGNSRARLLVQSAPLVVGFWLMGHTRLVQAQDFTVTVPADRTAPGDGSLRDAVIQANASSGTDRILLGANTYQLTLSGQDDLAQVGDLDITRSGGTLTIQGAGAASTIIDANMIDRAFEITNGGTVIFKDLTIRHGLATDSGIYAISESLGGAILSAGGTITLDHVVLDSNGALGAAGGMDSPGNDALGGAVYLSGGSLTLIACTLSNNVATGGAGGDGGFSGSPGATGGFAEGGAIYLATGSLNISSSTLGPGNMCLGGTGGTGADNYGGSTGNGGDGGGASGAGVFSTDSVLITNSTISSNVAVGGTGGISRISTTGTGATTGNDGNGGSTDGAGIDSHVNSILQLENSTVANNSGTPGLGGNFMTPGAPGTSTGGGLEFTGMTAAVDSTIFAGNTSATGPQVSGVIDSRFSLFESSAGVTFGSDVSNLKDVSAALQALANNGGPTLTNAIPATSPAHDAGENPLALTSDQRGPGFPRVSGSSTDIGAFELPAAPIVSITASSLIVKTGVDVTFTAVASDPQGLPLTFHWDFNDSTTATGNPVTHAFVSEGVFTVLLTVSDGLMSTQATIAIQTLAPNSGAATIPNIDDGTPPVVNPETGISIGILSSDGGVIEFGINVDSLLRNAVSVSTDFDSISGRTGTDTGLHFIRKFVDPGIVIATTTASDSATGAMKGRARKTVIISDTEIGDLPPQIKPPKNHSIHVTSIKGSFQFAKPTAASIGKPDLVTFAGSVELPAGLNLTQKPQVSFSIGNIVDSIAIDAKGHGILPSAKGRIKKLQFALPKLAKGTTQIPEGVTAKFTVTINQVGLSTAGFDTDGITNILSPTELKMKTIPRNVQVAMLVGGVPYTLLAPVAFKLSASDTSGTISGRSGN